MPLNTASAAFHITPVVIKTFCKHISAKASRAKKNKRPDVHDPTTDVLFDEAFHIVKAFIELGTHNVTEALQAYTNTHVPAPPWATVAPLVIPLTSCNDAADVLIDWFGPDELHKVVGGERWWQVRGKDGIDAEWITEKRYLDNGTAEKEQELSRKFGRPLREDEKNTLKMEKLDTVMLYIHGGGYYWGSINTHRYQILRYARKMKGRAFAVNYRKAPQYPWPCPLHDVLAAYLYLIRPPPTAVHSQVSPSRIVFAGDSAGGGLTVCALTIIRDMGLPMPAGAVLISPWVDLTHSFPSVMENTATDIIPPHGFIHKPSTLWPIVPRPAAGERIAETHTSPPPVPGHADTLKPSKERMRESGQGEDQVSAPGIPQSEMLDRVSISAEPQDDSGLQQKGDPARAGVEEDIAQGQGPTLVADGVNVPQRSSNATSETLHEQAQSWDPKPPKVLMEDPNATPLELHTQIQLYATNEQLTHPLVSPVLQGSLGNLCPLYILAGDGEVLRDEIIYLAHRAAHPEEYPPRMGSLNESRRQEENFRKFKQPTKVHLQVYDGMCHVLTVFTFMPLAKYAYRSIAEFIKKVTETPDDPWGSSPFPALNGDEAPHKHPNNMQGGVPAKDQYLQTFAPSKLLKPTEIMLHNSFTSSGSDQGNTLFQQSQDVTANYPVANDAVDIKKQDGDVEERVTEATTAREAKRDVVMIRERVDVDGHVRPMEPKEEIAVLRLKADEIGLLKEAPAKRWLTGQEEWDRKYKRTAKRVEKKRHKCEKRYEKLLERAKELGMVHASDGDAIRRVVSASSDIAQDGGHIQPDRRWGPLDLENETPPPSAIAKRRDTPDALVLLKKTMYYTAPNTVRILPKRKVKDVVKATFDPHDDPHKAPHQSSAEEQQYTEVLPTHGLRIWSVLMTLFARKTSRKTSKGASKAAGKLKEGGNNIVSSSSKAVGG